jgi:hypothetical protein
MNNSKINLIMVKLTLFSMTGIMTASPPPERLMSFSRAGCPFLHKIPHPPAPFSIKYLIPLPPSPLREGGKRNIINELAPLLEERVWGEVYDKKQSHQT